MKKIFFTVFFILILFYSGQAQKDGESRHGVAVIGRVLEDSILLRWGATTPIAWDLSNQYGYKIERITILRNNKLLDRPEKKILTPSPVKPWPMPEWEQLVEDDDYGAIAAQALFGETFEMTENMSSDMMQVVNKAKELEMRFSFALFSADQSVKVAKASGLYYADKDIREGEKYLYRVYSMIPQQKMAVDTGFVYLGPMDYAPLPSPTDLHADVTDRRVQLSWNRENFEGIYNSFVLERARTGEKFTAVNDKPIINTFEGEAPKTRYMFRADSLPVYNIEYSYRVRGINSFGEVGPPSDTVKVIALRVNEVNPVVVEKENINNEQVRLKWSFPADREGNITGFSVQRADNPNHTFDTLTHQIPVHQREFIDEQPHLNNYYVVSARDHAGNLKNSLTVLVQLVDSIPPVAPTDLHGKVDTTGLVTLQWKANPESDILGYRVYRANYAQEEFSQLTVAPISATVFYDTIPLKNLNHEIYYKIMAIDQRSNHSVLSKPVQLSKPDLLPPVPPVIRDIVSSPQGVMLEIVPSSSTDVQKHVVYRRKTKRLNWSAIHTMDSLSSGISYTDSTMTDYATYQYTVIAIDKAGLESDPAKVATGKKIDRGIRDEITKIYAEPDRINRFIKILWTYEKIGIDKFLLYRSDRDDNFTLYQTLPGTDREFRDQSLQVNTIYKYKIMAVYNSGARSVMSKEVKVNY